MSRARLWWQVHQWVGLKLTLLASFVLLTGTLAVIAHEIDWLLRPAMRVDVASVAGAGPDWAAIAATVAKREPAARVISLHAPIDPWFAAVAVVSRPIGNDQHRLGFVYLHPSTGEFLGTGHWVSVQRVLRNLHRHLMLPTRYGVPLVSSLALLLLATMITSFVIYKRWWQGFFKPVRFDRPRRAWGDFHRLAGVWSLWFVLLMVVTGLWYLVESLGGRAPLIGPAAQRGQELTAQQIATALPASLAAARQAFPGLRIEGIVFPGTGDASFRFEGQYRAILVRPRANGVWTDARDATVRKVVDARDLGVHQLISEMADPLHFGNFGGLWSKAIWFLFGALLTALSISGAAIYAIRLAGARAEGTGASVRRIWFGMGWLRWPCALLVVTSFVLLPALFFE
jgi:uncharacterized iron-regulated membrane protein